MCSSSLTVWNYVHFHLVHAKVTSAVRDSARIFCTRGTLFCPPSATIGKQMISSLNDQKRWPTITSTTSWRKADVHHYHQTMWKLREP
jgi:hypothetical protein